jgi:hypothetical protein
MGITSILSVASDVGQGVKSKGRGRLGGYIPRNGARYGRSNTGRHLQSYERMNLNGNDVKNDGRYKAGNGARYGERNGVKSR